MSEEPQSEELSAEGEGETVGEAKWAAMKELEPRFPGITADSVNFDVVEEPEGDGPARVRAEVDEEAAEFVGYRDQVGLAPMRGRERKFVHRYLSEGAAVETRSEGDEPDRRLVVSPAPAFGEH